MRAVAIAALCLFAYVPKALPHDWYEYQCCSDKDCRPIPFEAVTITKDGYRVPSGEVIPFGSRKIRPTPPEDPQQRYHWCTVAGSNKGGTLCLYVPQGGA